jgi:hypothetical protein
MAAPHHHASSHPRKWKGLAWMERGGSRCRMRMAAKCGELGVGSAHGESRHHSAAANDHAWAPECTHRARWPSHQPHCSQPAAGFRGHVPMVELERRKEGGGVRTASPSRNTTSHTSLTRICRPCSTLSFSVRMAVAAPLGVANSTSPQPYIPTQTDTPHQRKHTGGEPLLCVCGPIPGPRPRPKTKDLSPRPKTPGQDSSPRPRPKTPALVTLELPSALVMMSARVTGPAAFMWSC